MDPPSIYLCGPKLQSAAAMTVTGNKRDVSFIIDKYFALKKLLYLNGRRHILNFIVFIVYNIRGTLAAEGFYGINNKEQEIISILQPVAAWRANGGIP